MGKAVPKKGSDYSAFVTGRLLNRVKHADGAGSKDGVGGAEVSSSEIQRLIMAYKRPRIYTSDEYRKLINNPLLRNLIAKNESSIKKPLTHQFYKLFNRWQVISKDDNADLEEEVKNWLLHSGLLATSAKGPSVLRDWFNDLYIHGQFVGQIKYNGSEVDYIQYMDAWNVTAQVNPVDNRDVTYTQKATYKDKTGLSVTKETVFTSNVESGKQDMKSGAYSSSDIIFYKESLDADVETALDAVLTLWNIRGKVPQVLKKHAFPFVQVKTGSYGKDGSPEWPSAPLPEADKTVIDEWTIFKDYQAEVGDAVNNMDSEQSIVTTPDTDIILHKNEINKDVYLEFLNYYESLCWECMNFPKDLINARGQTLATTSTILKVMNPVWEGIQNTFQMQINKIINLKWPDKGLKLEFEDIDVLDSKTNAEIDKMSMETALMMLKGGFDDVSVKAFLKRKNFPIDTDKATINMVKTVDPGQAQHSTMPKRISHQKDGRLVLEDHFVGKFAVRINEGTIKARAQAQKIKDRDLTPEFYTELDNAINKHIPYSDDLVKEIINANTLNPIVGIKIKKSMDAAKFVTKEMLNQVKNLVDDHKNGLKFILQRELLEVKPSKGITTDIQKLLDTTEGRARTIAATEINRAVQESGIQYNMQMDKEFNTKTIAIFRTESGEACADCQEYEGKQYSLEDAQGVIPRHPNCRCEWEFRTVPNI